MAEDQDINRLVDDPDRDYDDEPAGGSPCTPYGATVVDTKPYLYVVQQEDLSSFWAIPQKFNLPAQGPGGSWRWHELRNANLDWPGGFVSVGGACVLNGLFAGAGLKVPASWPEPKPGVQVKKKNGATPSKGTAKAALIVGAVGLVGIGILAWVAARDKRRR